MINSFLFRHAKIDKSVTVNTYMVRTAGDVVSSYSLLSCIRCGECDSVCPSGRNGGMYPETIIIAILSSDPSSDIRDIQADVWKCLMCHRCAMACPEGIDVTGAIRALRYDSSLSSELPKRFRAASDNLVSHGRAFPVNDKVNQRRSELGLNKITEDERSLKELKTIISRTGFRHE
jgi:heterodisulfide reductase subunit C